MVCFSECLLISLAILLFLLEVQTESGIKTAEFLSPKVELEPGSVANKFFYGIDFPRGHIAVKNFDAELIDGEGNPVPLHEVYLHHWLVVSYYARKDDTGLKSDYVVVRNKGLCDERLVQVFGLGAETRRTSTDVPDPYGIEFGNPNQIPAGYEERWELNLHTIDTRGAQDKLGCAECRCDLFNLTDDQVLALPPGYNGGLSCCYDGAKCRVKEGFEGVRRSIFLRYRVRYMDWDGAMIIPVQVYVIDVTDVWTMADADEHEDESHRCLIEYDVEACDFDDGCIHTRTLTISLPRGGEVVYAVGHLHIGGVGSSLYGEGGRVICTSVPTYGNGDEPGNEAGYIVGMSTCYPSPGSVRISAGERLILVSNYSSAQRHTGVMGLFYLLIAETSVLKPGGVHTRSISNSNIGWGIGVLGVGLVIIYKVKNVRDEGYEEL